MKRFLFIALIALTLIGTACKTDSKKPDPDVAKMCGQCLDLPTGNVCTDKGTLKNNCMAICLGVKIECNGKCPCPK